MNITSKLYNLISNDNETIILQLTDASHPIFKAHFPSNPILPGFCHIEMLSEVLSDNITNIVLLKLRKKTLPNEKIFYKIINKDARRKVKIVDEENTLIGNITYEYNNNNSHIQ
ncbi:hypothetical protein OAR97_00250 [Arcobacteraceae bacterium]|nr:hypothetical protein [Arcobacteraceae bacterium]